MPGQPQQLVAPHMTSEALAAQTSPQARRRRTTRLMKTGSFCSITSEGDGDIFSDEVCSGGVNYSGGGCGTSPAASSINSQPRGSTSSSGKYDPLSDYSEWQNEDTRSDISELFSKQQTAPVVTQQQQTTSCLQPEVLQQQLIAETGSGTTGENVEGAHHLMQQVVAEHKPQHQKDMLSVTSASLEDISYEVPTTTVLTPKVTHHAAMASDVNIDAEVSSISLSIGMPWCISSVIYKR